MDNDEDAVPCVSKACSKIITEEEIGGELSQIQKKIKFISDAKGKPVEGVLPYEVYQEYMDMKISLEFYKSLETQDSIERAKEDIAAGRFKDYGDVE